MIIKEQFDSRTLAAMDMALDQICQAMPHGEEHATRKYVAKHIIKCAESGRTTLAELTAAGQDAFNKAALNKAAPAKRAAAAK